MTARSIPGSRPTCRGERGSIGKGFTARYRCKLLVWYEFHETMPGAINREKQIKAGSRKKKLALIEGSNPAWRDLYGDLA